MWSRLGSDLLHLSQASFYFCPPVEWVLGNFMNSAEELAPRFLSTGAVELRDAAFS